MYEVVLLNAIRQTSRLGGFFMLRLLPMFSALAFELPQWFGIRQVQQE